VGAIGRTPSDVFLFSKLPEADQQAILRQANKEEFERYIGHAHMKLRKPMRDERIFNPLPQTAPEARVASPVERSITPPTNPAPMVPQRSTPPPPPRGRTRVDQLLQTSPLAQ
jgi:hypothetical protein